jgi:hypothetical protein
MFKLVVENENWWIYPDVVQFIDNKYYQTLIQKQNQW